MTRTNDNTPYADARARRRRAVFVVLGAVLAVALAVALHLAGVLPPN
ncbi:MAG TPA: hypothetical protein VK925_09510 [Jiangellaceae bacterium]|jgi:hypothetical protein|nr:hypothetical protein [Jiangellaceae bacterium]